jgi:hypothetical protein
MPLIAESDAPMAAGPATSQRTLIPAPGQQPIVAPEPIATV